MRYEAVLRQEAIDDLDHIAFRESEGKHFFTVFFHFDEDEATLIITHIGYTLYE